MTPKYFVPSRRYKSISLTGSWCALNCRFCGGRYLKNMVHVNPGNLWRVLRDLYEGGVRGVLLSGGFRLDGTLPIEPYLDELKRAKRELNVIISAHLGLVKNRDLLLDLEGLVDVVDYEFTTSKYIIRDVRGLLAEPDDYVESLKLMIESGLRVVPHVFAWHPEASEETVEKELKILEDLGVREATLLVYIDDAYRHVAQQLAPKVERLITRASNAFSGKLYMGCMRPSFLKPLLDASIVKGGYVERIANPYYRLLEDIAGEVYDACCSLSEDSLAAFRVESAGYLKRVGPSSPVYGSALH